MVLALAEYETLEESLYLSRGPTNVERLLRSIKEVEEGKLVEYDLDE